jgi:hypothetical protein
MERWPQRRRKTMLVCCFPPLSTLSNQIYQKYLELPTAMDEGLVKDALIIVNNPRIYNTHDQRQQQQQEQISSQPDNDVITQMASNQPFSNLNLQQGQSMLQYTDLNGDPTIVRPPALTEHPDNQSTMEFDDPSLAEFLLDIMMPDSSQPLVHDSAVDCESQYYSSRDVFDFGLDTSLDFTDIDLDWITTYDSQATFSNSNSYYINQSQPLTRGQQTPDIRNGFSLGAQAFQNSLWRWAPALGEHGYAEQANFALPSSDMEVLERSLIGDNLEQRLERVSRDQILAMILGTCEPTIFSKIVSSFPTSEMLNHLMHQFFKFQLSQTDSWIHIPTFRPSMQKPELNGIIVAAGAVLSAAPAVRKLGYAIMEAVRLALPKSVRSLNPSS